MKKIMILGAGVYQIPLIKKAKEMGIWTIVVSIPGNYPGFEFADKIYYVDTTDYDEILKIAKEESIDGIVTAGTDVAVVTIGKVCDELGLKGLSFESAQIASNKMLMKTKYEKYDVRTARFRKVGFEIENVINEIKELCFPLIFKAVDTSGSRGIIKVTATDDISSAIEYVKSATKLNYFIVEEFLDGDEFGAQAFIYNGKVQFILPHGDYVFNGNTGVPVGHYAPYEIDEDIINDAFVQLQRATEAMGLDNCAINADFILHDNKVYVLELGGRSGATCLAELTGLYYGYNYYEKIILAALGEKVSFDSEYRVPNACMLLMSEKDGIIKTQANINKASDNIVDVKFDYDVGDSVKKFKVGPDRIGHVITKGNNLDEAIEELNKALENIIIEVE